MPDSGVGLQSSRQTRSKSTFQGPAQIVIIETATERVSNVQSADRRKGATSVCFGWSSVRVLAGRGCVLFRNARFFQRAIVVVWRGRPKSHD